MEERIKLIYNDCWKIYRTYLLDHNIEEYSRNAKALEVKYGRKEDIRGLLDWFCVQVDALHREFIGVNRHGSN